MSRGPADAAATGGAADPGRSTGPVSAMGAAAVEVGPRPAVGLVVPAGLAALAGSRPREELRMRGVTDVPG